MKNYNFTQEQIDQFMQALEIDKNEVEKVLQLSSNEVVFRFIDGHEAKFQVTTNA